MWIDRKTYDDLRLENAKLQGICQEQARANASLQSSFDWLRVRVTQLERERAQLINNYMGIKVEVPEIEVVAKDKRGAESLSNAAASFFTDMGDEEALKQGISWNEEGELVYTKPQV